MSSIDDEAVKKHRNASGGSQLPRARERELMQNRLAFSLQIPSIYGAHQAVQPLALVHDV